MSNTISIDELIEQEYEQQYFEECKFIWQNFVPKSGQARNLQGELLREIENIRCEAQDNGNVNWDDDLTYFCEFIKQSLIEQPIFSEPEKEKICVIMNYLKECGVYAQRFNDGKISDNDVLPEKLAYTKDNLYDIICDFISSDCYAWAWGRCSSFRITTWHGRIFSWRFKRNRTTRLRRSVTAEGIRKKRKMRKAGKTARF